MRIRVYKKSRPQTERPTEYDTSGFRRCKNCGGKQYVGELITSEPDYPHQIENPTIEWTCADCGHVIEIEYQPETVIYKDDEGEKYA